MITANASTTPTDVPRRSFIHRILQHAGAHFVAINDGAIAADFGKPIEAEVAQARRMGIADLSVLPRTGFKGAGTVEWLAGQGLSIGPDSNRAYPQSGGELAARLAPTETFLIDGFAGSGELVRRLDAAWSWGSENPRKLIGYPMPRSESHAWFLVTGEHASAMFAKVCGVDLRTHRFASGSIAQTSLAKMSAVIIRIDLGGSPAFHVLADSASAEYLWGCLLDAMTEFDGAPVGWMAIRELAGVR
jgi:sarcosine oxidase, subunit gamma